MCLGVPGQVVSLGETEDAPAVVSFGGVTRAISLAFVPEARVGDHVMVHAGFALSVVDEEALRLTAEYLASLDEEAT